MVGFREHLAGCSAAGCSYHQPPSRAQPCPERPGRTLCLADEGDAALDSSEISQIWEQGNSQVFSGISMDHGYLGWQNTLTKTGEVSQPGHTFRAFCCLWRCLKQINHPPGVITIDSRSKPTIPGGLWCFMVVYDILIPTNYILTSSHIYKLSLIFRTWQDLTEGSPLNRFSIAIQGPSADGSPSLGFQPLAMSGSQENWQRIHLVLQKATQVRSSNHSLIITFQTEYTGWHVLETCFA